jgi:hypothetical protein
MEAKIANVTKWKGKVTAASICRAKQWLRGENVLLDTYMVFDLRISVIAVKESTNMNKWKVKSITIMAN